MICEGLLFPQRSPPADGLPSGSETSAQRGSISRRSVPLTEMYTYGEGSASGTGSSGRASH